MNIYIFNRVVQQVKVCTRMKTFLFLLFDNHPACRYAFSEMGIIMQADKGLNVLPPFERYIIICG